MKHYCCHKTVLLRADVHSDAVKLEALGCGLRTESFQTWEAAANSSELKGTGSSLEDAFASCFGLHGFKSEYSIKLIWTGYFDITFLRVTFLIT